MKNSFIAKLVTALVLSILFVNACGTSSGPTNNSPNNNNDSGNENTETIAKSDSVAPDGILESVTWNLEWYGDTSHGPSPEIQQTKNILQVTDSLKADLYAFEEVYDQTALDSLVKYMRGYHGFVAKAYPRDQHTSFVFNTLTIDSVSSGMITEGQDEHDWASGRYPFYFSFKYHYQGKTIPIFAVTIHAKAGAGKDDYNRRKAAADSLYTYLTKQKPDANIIFLGDYNDDVDESIYDGAETPYQLFVDDKDHYLVVTKALSDSNQSSETNYPSTIDHITISNELVPLYMDGSVQAFHHAEDFITNYGETTSDHYPVWAKFDITKQKVSGQ